jgi:hypothetical protein
MGVILKDLQRVQWTRLQAAGETSARAVPALLSKAAWSERDTARQAVEELGDLVCELGFVVQEATAPTVPFLVELVGAPTPRARRTFSSFCGKSSPAGSGVPRRRPSLPGTTPTWPGRSAGKQRRRKPSWRGGAFSRA